MAAAAPHRDGGPQQHVPRRHRLNAQAGALEHRGQRLARIAAHMPHGVVMLRPELRVRRDGNQGSSVRTQHAPNLSRDRKVVLDMLQEVEGNDHVDAAIRDGQSARITSYRWDAAGGSYRGRVGVVLDGKGGPPQIPQHAGVATPSRTDVDRGTTVGLPRPASDQDTPLGVPPMAAFEGR